MPIKKSLLFIIFLLNTTLYAWTPSKFGVSCESYEILLSMNSTNYDPITNVNCIDKKRRELIEKYLEEALLSIKQKKFYSPKGKSLGPVVIGKNLKNNVVRIATGYAGIAATVGQCNLNGSRKGTPYSYVSINEKLFEKIPPYRAFIFLTHELVHVIQHSQKFYLKSSFCHKIPMWVTEGTADAITYDLTYKKFQYMPSYKTAIYKSFYGLRDYSIAFGYSFPKNSNHVLQNYRTSSFWNYLESNYYHDDFKFLSTYLNILPTDIVAKEDWLAWLNQLLISNKKGPKKPLYLVYPEFIAHYANWAKYKYKRLGQSASFRERRWLSESFHGCKIITLSPSSPKKNILLKLEPISAKCIKVAVQGLEGNKEANIKIMAYDSSTKKLDNLHVSTAYAQAKLVESNKDFNCYRDVTFKHKERTCIDKPIMGKIPAGKDNKKALVKTWRTPQQKFVSSKEKNLYLLSYVPLKPKDKSHANRQKQEVYLTIALDYTKFKPSSKKTAKRTSSQVGLTGHTGAKNGSDIPTSGTESMDFSSLVNDNEGLSKLLMGMNVPDVTASLRGIHMITLKDFEGSDENIKNNITLSLIVENPIEVGSIGSFKTTVMGGIGEEESIIKITGNSIDMSNLISNAGNEPSATIKILEYSKELLHIKTQGTYCRGRSISSGECLKVENFSAEIFKPLGLAYGSGGIKSMDSPGMKIYRENHYNRIMTKGNLGLPKEFDNIGKDTEQTNTESSQSSSSNGNHQKCTCSCKEYNIINQQMEESGDKRPENAGYLMNCMMSCMMQYMKCDE